MKLINALELGKECGLKNVSSSLLNVEHYAMNMFVYSEINKEFKELVEEYNNLYKKGIIDGSTSIDEALKILKGDETNEN